MSSLFEKSEMSAALRHLLPAYHSRGCLSEYSLNHGLEDQIQNKNRVRPADAPCQRNSRFDSLATTVNCISQTGR